MPITPGLRSCNSTNWETPQEFFDNLNDKFNFGWDLAASLQNAKCQNYFTMQDNALQVHWPNDVWCWLNPPYGNELPFWCEKAWKESSERDCKIVMLVPARTDTKWFHNFVINKAARIYFIEGRIKFVDENGIIGKQPGFPSMIVVYHEDSYLLESGEIEGRQHRCQNTKFGVLNNNGTIKLFCGE